VKLKNSNEEKEYKRGKGNEKKRHEALVQVISPRT
jgi:hypothetical protein